MSVIWREEETKTVGLNKRELWESFFWRNYVTFLAGDLAN